MDQVEIILFCCHTHQTGLADQTYFLSVILSRQVCLKNLTVKWSKQNCLLCQNLIAYKAALQLLWRLANFWQSVKIWQVFETGGCTYFTLLVDRFFLIQAINLALLCPGPNSVLLYRIFWGLLKQAHNPTACSPWWPMACDGP